MMNLKKDSALRLRLVSLGTALGITCIAGAQLVDVPHQFKSGDPVSSRKINENFTALSESFSEFLISGDVEIRVPEDHPTLPAALEYVGARSIVGNANVTIKLADGRYDLAGSLGLGHPDGSRIRIVGNEETPEDVELFFSGTDGFVVDAGTTWKGLAGVTLIGSGSGKGITVETGAHLSVESGVTVRNFQTGYYAKGSLVATSTEAVDNIRGYVATQGGFIDATSATADSTGRAGAEHGFSSTEGSVIRAADSIASHFETCYQTNNQSYLFAQRGAADDCPTAFHAGAGCVVSAFSTVRDMPPGGVAFSEESERFGVVKR